MSFTNYFILNLTSVRNVRSQSGMCMNNSITSYENYVTLSKFQVIIYNTTNRNETISLFFFFLNSLRVKCVGTHYYGMCSVLKESRIYYEDVIQFYARGVC